MTVSTKIVKTEIERISSNSLEFGIPPEVSQSISFESALFGILSIIKDDKNKIEIKDNSIHVPSDKREVLEKISFCMEFLCNIPFTFKYNTSSDTYSCDFSYLSSEMSMIFG